MGVFFGAGLSPSIPVRSKRLEFGFPGGGVHSRAEDSAVEPGERLIGNVGLSLRDWTFRLTTPIEGVTLRSVTC